MKKLLNTIRKDYTVAIMLFSICLSLILRFFCLDYESGDFLTFLDEWINFYKLNGGFKALKSFDGDYNVLYQYLLIIISYFSVKHLYVIKIVSIIFDYLLAYGCMKLLGALDVDDRKQRICFSVIILLPTFLLNSSLWSQCDSIYVSFIIWSIYFLIKKKNVSSIAFLAVAFALKLQTVFIMPVYFMFFLKKEIKFKELFVFPAVTILIYLPAILLGKSLADILNIYVTQTKEYPLMVMNAPSIFKLLGIFEYNKLLEKVFICLAGVFVLIIVFVNLKRGKSEIFKTALLFSVGIPFLLPHMHERYFYIATVMAVICVFAYGKKYIAIMLCVEISSLICYLHYFEIINIYCGKILSHIVSTNISALLMCIALVIALITVFFKADFKKYIICTVTSLMMVLVIFSVSTRFHYFAWFDDKLINFTTVEPYLDEEGNIMIPLRNFVNAIGANLFYDKKTNKITVDYNNSTLQFEYHSNIAGVNGEDFNMIKTFVPSSHSYLSHKDIPGLFNFTCKVSGNKLYFNKN